jgi:hypothetical protein
MAQLDTGRTKLVQSFEALLARWEQAKAQWDDAARAQFEEQFWQHLPERVASAARAADRLGQVIGSMKEACE